MLNTLDKQRYKLAWLVVAICLIMFGITIYDQISKQQKFRSDVQAKIEAQTKIAASNVGQKLWNLEQQTLEFREQVEQIENPHDILPYLKSYFDEHQDLFTLNVTFIPYRLDDNLQYVSPYYERFEGDTKLFQLTDYDNKLPEFSWYHRPFFQGAIWTEPYYERHNDVLMTTYSVPFVSKQDKLRGKDISGVIPTDVSLEYLTRELQELDLGLGGYGMIFSSGRKLIAHPVFSYVREGRDFQQLLRDQEFAFLGKITECFDHDQLYRFYNGEIMDDDEDYAACIKVPHTNWTLVTRMSADMFEMNKNGVRQGYIHAIGWLTLAIFVALRVIADNPRSITSASANIKVSMLLLVSTIGVLVLANKYAVDNVSNGSTISNLAQREAFIDNYQHMSTKLRNKEPIFIPTGLFIQSIEFVNAYNVHLTGDIWQRFSEKGVPLSDIGVDFPNAIDKSLVEVYRNRNEHGELVVGYQFNITLRQDFTYSKYPFDSKAIDLQVKHTRLGDNVMLVPDLESFEKLGNKDHSSILDSVVLEEWHLNQSFYNYLYKHSKTSFGIENHRALKEPILTYTIVLDREFVGPFVTALLPILVMICLLYACIVSMPHTDYSELRNNITAIIFTILLAHYSIREHLQIDEVIYLELFYFLLYFIASVFMYLSHKFYITKEQPELNRKYKALSVGGYWPVLTSSVLVLTVFTYY